MNLALTERRKSPQHTHEVSRSPGIRRIYFDAIEAYKAHDKACEARGDPKHQKGYSLYKHVERTSDAMLEVSSARGRDQWDTDLGTASALLHDIGKTHPSIINYRLDRQVTSDEKDVIDRHAQYSWDLVRKAILHVRPVDRRFLLQVGRIVTHHHRPDILRSFTLRVIGYDLLFVDALIARMEDRGSRLGLPQKEAVDDFLPLWMEIQAKRFPDMFADDKGALAQDSFNLIQDLYGYRNGRPKIVIPKSAA